LYLGGKNILEKTTPLIAGVFEATQNGGVKV
jgi:hypothetical protein